MLIMTILTRLGPTDQPTNRQTLLPIELLSQQIILTKTYFISSENKIFAQTTLLNSANAHSYRMKDWCYLSAYPKSYKLLPGEIFT